MRKLLRNRIKCKSCGDVIESKTVHNWVRCTCGKVYVDGGLEYSRRGFPRHPQRDWIEDLCEYEEASPND